MIGLAGQPGSGKSTVAQLLAERAGVEAIDLDRVAWEVYAPSTPTYERLVERFGCKILSGDGRIDRGRLAARAFESEAAREDLEAIVHPAVIARLIELKGDADVRSIDLLVVEGALLASSSHVDRSIFDSIIWLEVSDETRRERLRVDGREAHADRMVEVRPDVATDVVNAEGAVGEVAERVRRAIAS